MNSPTGEYDFYDLDIAGGAPAPLIYRGRIVLVYSQIIDLVPYNSDYTYVDLTNGLRRIVKAPCNQIRWNLDAWLMGKI